MYNVEKISSVEVAGRTVVAEVEGRREVLGLYFNKRRAELAFDNLVLWINGDGAEGKVHRMITDTEAARLTGERGFKSAREIMVDAGLYVDCDE